MTDTPTPDPSIPRPPALGYLAFTDAVEAVESPTRHRFCSRATGGGGIHLEVVGTDGIPTYHDIAGQKIGCIFPLLDLDPRVDCWRFVIREVG